MKNIRKTQVLILTAILTFILITSVKVNISAADISYTYTDTWKQSLKDFLTDNFPSLFDQATILKNQEVLNNWLNSWGTNENGHTDYDINTYVPNSGDIPIDALSEWNGLNPYYPWLLPNQCNFYDLDSDGIPEVFITYPTVYAEGSDKFAYKLYNDKYEEIETGEYLDGTYMVHDELYTNPQNRTVVIRYGPDGGEKISFLDISGKQVVYSDYIDSKGNSYNDLWLLLYDTEINKYDEAKFNEMLAELTPIPEFDCADIIDSIVNKSSVNTAPKTGNTNIVVIAVIIFINTMCIFAILKLDKKAKKLKI